MPWLKVERIRTLPGLGSKMTIPEEVAVKWTSNANFADFEWVEDGTTWMWAAPRKRTTLGNSLRMVMASAT